jgi:hypothetical protein
MPGFNEFLVRIQTDYRFYLQFRNNSDEALASYKLSPEETAALKDPRSSLWSRMRGVPANGDELYYLLLYRKPIHKEIPCILWQAHVVADPTYQTERRLVEDFLPLQNYLLDFYPPEHLVTLVLSKTFPLVEPLVETFSLGTLAERLVEGPQLGNLYIPPVAPC